MTKINGFQSSSITLNQSTTMIISSAGDFNGDGRFDIVIGLPFGNFGNGEVYVIYGRENNIFPDIKSVEEYLLNDNTKGFRIRADGSYDPGNLGSSVMFVKDFNQDGFDDLVIGAPGFVHFVQSCPFSDCYIPPLGCNFVVYGRGDNIANIDSIWYYLQNNTFGFFINDVPEPFNGVSQITSAGDINGDGINDIVVAANPDYTFVIYGSITPIENIIFPLSNISSPSMGFVVRNNNSSSFYVSGVGDFNDDSIDDIIISGTVIIPNNSGGATPSGTAYIIYGKKGSIIPNIPSIDDYLLNDKNGFKIFHNTSFLNSVSLAGDVNKDYITDIIICGKTVTGMGAAYILYGHYGGYGNINSIEDFLTDNSKGFKIYGTKIDDSFCSWGSGLGDINGDGIGDIGIGAPTASYKNTQSGAVYFIFGQSYNLTQNIPSIEDYYSMSVKGFKIYGQLSNSQLGYSVNGMGLYNNKTTILIGANGFNGTISSAIIIYPQYANYGMFSHIDDFIAMNVTTTNSVGKVYMGLNQYWCNGDSLHTGDFNGDGKTDFICNQGIGKNSIFLSATDGNNVAFTPMSNEIDGYIKIGENKYWCSKHTQKLLIGDFNNDGTSDLFCRDVSKDDAKNFVMFSNGTAFYPMGNSPDGYVNIGDFGSWCHDTDKLVVGNFTGSGGDSLICNHPLQGSFLMVPNGTSFISYNPSDPTGAVAMGDEPVWCIGQKDRLLAADFNGDGLTDLICNSDGFNMIMVSKINKVTNNFKTISTSCNQNGGDSIMFMGNCTIQNWCPFGSKLLTGNVNADQYADLICNDGGTNMVQLCVEDSEETGVIFIAMSAKYPNGIGTVSMGNHESWCTSGNIFAGNIRGIEVNGYPISDIWCNQAGDVV